MPNLKLKQVIISAVENQLKDNNPQEVEETLERLMEEDKHLDYYAAIEKIGAVLIEEMHRMMKEKEEFDLKRYISKLKNL